MPFTSNVLKRLFIIVPTISLMACLSTNAMAWGEDGHSAIGILAMTQVQARARHELATIIDIQDEDALAEACNWPDVVRETDTGESTAPNHYINIPRGDYTYLKSRDCADGRCATEAVKRAADELADRSLTTQKRWQAFAWLCHVVGDLHQPLHAGFGDDRGGNNVDVTVRGKQMNLHAYWDHELTDRYTGDLRTLIGFLGLSRTVPESSLWSKPMVDDWTNASHEIARFRVYPDSSAIDEGYEQQSWEIARETLGLAAHRLAWILNTVLQ